MKKTILFLFLAAMSSSLFSQTNYDKRVENNVNAYIERVENNITLSKEEKEKIFDLKKVHTINFWKVTEELKDKPTLDEERKKVGKAFSSAMIEEFGRKRGLEILKASRVKKDVK